MKTRLADAIERFVRDRFQVPEGDPHFHRTAHLFEEGYVDSTGLIEMVAHIESAFGVVIPEDAMFDPAFNSIEGMASVLSRLPELSA